MGVDVKPALNNVEIKVKAELGNFKCCPIVIRTSLDREPGRKLSQRLRL